MDPKPLPCAPSGRTCWLAVVLVVLATCLVGLAPRPASAALPAGFSDDVVMSGTSCTSVAGSTRCLSVPTNVEFAPDGRLFVTEKRGVVKVFDGVTDRSPELVADLRTQVFNSSDSGLLGLAVDPGFPARPYIYLAYAYDAPPGGTAPAYGTAGADDDECPTTGGCPTTGRVTRLTLSGSRMVSEQVLSQGSCHAFASHAIDEVQFGPDGMLYATTGDGASSMYADYGQGGNGCGDPPTPAGTAPSAGTSEAGSLRSQDARTTADPTGLNGTLIRMHPDTGAGAPGNPFASSPDPEMRKIAAFGLRNPYRFAFRPGSQSQPGGPEAYVADVGWNSYEEIDVVDVGDGAAENFGWPCYEGPGRLAPWDNLNNTLCESLYTAGTAKAPFFSYHHNEPVTSTACPDSDAAAIGGIAFYPGGSYPDEYDGALFIADYTRHCLMVMKTGPDGRPLPSTLTDFGMMRAPNSTNGPWPVDLEVGPGGDLYYVDVYQNMLHRISYAGGGSTNQPPTAVATASPSNGPVGTTVAFDATGSRDPEGQALAYAWDLDGDGAYDDASGPTASRTYDTAGRVAAGVRVQDSAGATAVAAAPVEIGTQPVVTISVAESSQTWHVGERLTFTGAATEPSGAAVPESALSWSATLFHCEAAGCHPHPETGAKGGSFEFTAPDHSAPAYLDVTLTATGADGATGTRSVRLDPDTTTIALTSEPSGLRLGFDDAVVTTPATRTEIVGSAHSVSAADQVVGTSAYAFDGWSDAGAAVHNITVASSPMTLKATFTQQAATTRTVVLTAVEDTMARQSASGTAYGSATTLWSDGQATSSASSRDTSYLRFAVPALAPGESITGARLSLRVVDATSNGPSVWRTDPSWSESAVTWSSGQPPRIGTAPVGGFGSMATGRVSTALSGVTAAGPVSVQLYADSTDGLDFSSSEHSTVADRPQLVLTVVAGTTPSDTTPPPAPAVSPASGTYSSAQSVTMTSSEAGAVIRYTVGAGTSVPEDPTTSSSAYSGAMTVATSSVVKAAAFDAAGNRSAITRRDYTVNATTRTVVLTAVEDTMARQSASGTAYGSATTLWSDGQATSSASSRDTSYLRFAVPALAPGESITGARLSLRVVDATSNGPSVWRTDPSWSESAVTWSSGQPPRIGTAPVGGFGSMATGRVSTALSGVTAAGPVSVQLYADSTDGLDFSSSEHSTVADRPQLVLTVSLP